MAKKNVKISSSKINVSKNKYSSTDKGFYLKKLSNFKSTKKSSKLEKKSSVTSRKKDTQKVREYDFEILQEQDEHVSVYDEFELKKSSKISSRLRKIE